MSSEVSPSPSFALTYSLQLAKLSSKIVLFSCWAKAFPHPISPRTNAVQTSAAIGFAKLS